jgi:polar amino acid transport system permease protein
MIEFSIWDICSNLLLAARWTIALSIIAFVGGGVAAMPLTWLLISPGRVRAGLVHGYIEVFQGTPLLVQLFLAFFGISALGIDISPWLAAAIALTLSTSAYLCDIWSGAINAIPHVQWEAARSLGFSRYETLRHVVLGQAARIAIAPTVGYLVQVIKGTALASLIGFTEVTRTATMLNNVAFMPIQIFGALAAMYFILCFPLSQYSRKLEKRINVNRSR